MSMVHIIRKVGMDHSEIVGVYSDPEVCGRDWAQYVVKQREHHLMTPSAETAGSGQIGVCTHCGKPPTPEGHDGCLGTLPGPIWNACCGHGRVRQAYIQYEGGSALRGRAAVFEQKRLRGKRNE